MTPTTSPTPSPAGTADGTTRSAGPRWLRALRRRERAVLVANLVAQIGIVVTGGAVRLTGSGLGCSTWPMCEPGQFTPAFHEATDLHPYIEFGNRTLTGVLGVIAILVAVLVWSDVRRSRGYRWLGLVPLLGVVAQAVIGGITVLVDLHPAIVGGHLLISMALVAASAALLHRSREGDGPATPTATQAARTTAAVMLVALVPMLVLGVIVTGSGPHSGDEDAAYRFALDPAHMTRLHAVSVWVFLAILLVLATLVLRRRPVHGPARRSVVLLLVVTLLQGGIGYAQYFTGLPVLLVGLHMLGAAVLTAAATVVPLNLRTRAGTDTSPVADAPARY
ncbi:COX15/CtaA family protein [Sanguibacter suaedae]|uniref:COX15/CtaA family protein n=1 Tax=Sanguibacter suaedae TaxID=2795737 RepID=UPI0027DBEEB6|nr:COX15/CtaA family protein [Sanguibacter suaedae]